MKQFKSDTIAAIATSVVGSTIGVIRISGKKSLDILNSIVRKKIKKPRYVYLRNIYDHEKQLDNVIVIFFKSPASYSGEDMVEIQCHGGYVTLRRIYELVLSKGARPAEKGEFTRRGFFNGKFDLTQAESINNLINANNSVIADNSLKMMNGIFSKRINDLRDNIIEIIAFIEAYIDFPEDDVEEIGASYLRKNINMYINRLNEMCTTYNIYKKLKDGIKVAIAGRPNAGKSSLLNAILKEEKAIVTHIPGTTRDVLEHELFINGLNVVFYDTAGIRKTEDTVESIGIEKAINTVKDADIVIYLIDSSEGIKEEDVKILQKIKDKKLLVLFNKYDLTDKDFNIDQGECIKISLKTGFNFDKFEKYLHKNIIPENFINSELDFFVDNVRYVNSLEKVISILKEILNKLDLPLEYIAEDLKEVKNTLGEIIGEVYHDDILEKIFSTFCIGK